MAEATSSVMQIRDTTANPAPLGLLAFGMTTVLLNIHNAGGYGMNSMILAMGLFYGGSAQVIAGVLEWKKNNTFGTTAFTSFGMFWLMLAATFLLPKLWPEFKRMETATGSADERVGGVYAGDVCGDAAVERGAEVVFGSLVVLFGLLAGVLHGEQGLMN